MSFMVKVTVLMILLSFMVKVTVLMHEIISTVTFTMKLNYLFSTYDGDWFEIIYYRIIFIIADVLQEVVS